MRANLAQFLSSGKMSRMNFSPYSFTTTKIMPEPEVQFLADRDDEVLPDSEPR